MSVSKQERIVTLLAAGVPQVAVAEATGVTPGYVSQLLDMPEIQEAIAVKKAAQLEEELGKESQMQRIEQVALDRIEKMLPFAKLETAAGVFEKMNKARKSAFGNQHPDAVPAGSVLLVLPAAAQTFIQMNAQNQVIAVDHESIAPLPSKALPDLAKRVAATGLQAPGSKQQAQINAAAALINNREKRDVEVAQTKLERLQQDIPMILNGVPVVI